MFVSRLDYTKETEDKWGVFLVGRESEDANFLHTTRKRIASIVRDVDGEWLLFFDNYNGGGFPLYVMAELVSILCRFRGED